MQPQVNVGNRETHVRVSLYIISDLHLGGAPAPDGGRSFQICPPRTQAALAAFVGRLPGRQPGIDCRLVIAGDVVDFLAEQPFEAFTADPLAACAKLANIFKHTAPVWDALRAFVHDRHGALTLMLGNHDIELSLPGVRESLLERLGTGRIDFIYDNEACTIGPVLIEHGNRFDAWNAVPHGALRRVRSQLSRRLAVTPAFPTLPGSRLVTEVMNPLKQTYPFVDLLKPEDAAALPVVAALGASSVRDVWRFFGNFRRQWAIDYDESREPLDETLIDARPDADQAAYDLAETLASGGQVAQISAVGNLLAGIGSAVTDKLRAARREALFTAFHRLRHHHRQAFAVDQEIDTYRVPAQRAAQAGFQVIVYGHTHLAKRVALGAPGAARPVYLNTGTWADLMRVPEAVWADDGAASRQALASFVDDLEGNQLDRWRRAVPTYARIELDGAAVLQADVHFADSDDALSSAGLQRRLAGETDDGH